MDGDNSLDGATVQDFNEMAKVGSSDNVTVVVLLDRRNEGASIYKVEKGVTLDKASPLVEKGEVNMGDPDILEEFVNYAVSEFPSEKIALIFWNHGDGWRSVKKNSVYYKAASYDEDDGSGQTDALYMWEVVRALDDLKNGKNINIDLVGFDECLMGMIEVAIDLSNYTDSVVFSELTEPYDGWNYEKVLESVADNPDISAYDFGKRIVDSYVESYKSYSGEYTLAVLNSTLLMDIKDALESFVLSYLSADNREELKRKILSARDSSIEADDGYGNKGENTYVDLKNLFENIYSNLPESNLKERAFSVLEATDKVYVGKVGNINYSGLSIYFPKEASSYESEYGFEVPSYSYYYGENYYNPSASFWRWDEFIQNLLNVE